VGQIRIMAALLKCRKHFINSSNILLNTRAVSVNALIYAINLAAINALTYFNAINATLFTSGVRWSFCTQCGLTLFPFLKQLFLRENSRNKFKLLDESVGFPPAPPSSRLLLRFTEKRRGDVSDNAARKELVTRNLSPWFVNPFVCQHFVKKTTNEHSVNHKGEAN